MAYEAQTRLKIENTGTRIVLLGVAMLAFGLVPQQTAARDLNRPTLAAWDAYVNSASRRIETQVRGSSFLQIDEKPEQRRQVDAGEIAVWPDGGSHPVKVPHGLIHDWLGAVFIPKATIADFLAVNRNYAGYPAIYKPAVIRAEEVNCSGNDDKFTMLWEQKVLFVTTAVQGEYETQYIEIDQRHWYAVSQSTQLQAIEGFGQPDMRVLPPDQGPGYIWRLYSFTSLEQTHGGLYVELEALGLTRDVPATLRWLVDPVIDHLPKDSLRATLEETRNAILARVNREDEVSRTPLASSR